MKFFLYLMTSLVVPCMGNIISPSIPINTSYAFMSGSMADSSYTGPTMIALCECSNCPGIIFGSSDPDDEVLTILNSGIHINSFYNPGGSSGALDIAGNLSPSISAYYINVVGGIDEHFDIPEDVYVHDYTDGIEPVPDPYAYMPDAVYSTTPDLGTITTSGTYSPGYYSGGIQISNGITVELQPGNYYLDSVGQPASLVMTGGLIVGESVTLHIIGNADYGIYMNGGDIDIAAPISGVHADIAIFEKRDPDYDCAQSCASPWSKAVPMSVFSGNVSTNIDGVVYIPHNRLELGGTGDLSMTRVIADRIYIYGDSQKVIGYDGGNSYAPWDLVPNGIVDLDDLCFFTMQWGVDGIYKKSDLNYDLRQDLSDFAIFAAHWLEGIE